MARRRAHRAWHPSQQHQSGATATLMLVTIQEHVRRERVASFLGSVARYSRPDEQAWPMIVLNSPRLSFVNGVGLPTDGGALGAMLVGLIDAAELEGGSGPPRT